MRRYGKLCAIIFAGAILVACGNDESKESNVTKEKNTTICEDSTSSRDDIEETSNNANETSDAAFTDTPEDGTYEAEVIFAGGSGKAKVLSPAVIEVKDGKVFATITWSSKNYDYMIVNGEKYLNEADSSEQSKFTIPVSSFGEEMTVIGDTVAMSKPHEIEYKLTFNLKK